MQVLSNSVAKALQLTQGDEVAETITFVDKFNKFFDTLNVSSISAGKLKRSPFKDVSFRLQAEGNILRV